MKKQETRSIWSYVGDNSVQQAIWGGLCALLVIVAAWATASGAEPKMSGTWSIESDRGGGEVQLTIARSEGHSRWRTNRSIALSSLSGLTRAQIDGRREDAIFEIRRDAGVFSFNGVFDRGLGTGRFTFAPDPEFAETLRREGFPGATSEDLFTLAMHDVSLDHVRGFKGLGFRDLDLETIKRLRIHGATPETARELRATGIETQSAEGLIRMCIHDVSPEYVRAMGALGYRRLQAEDVVRMKIHGVSADYVRAMAKLDYRDIDAESLIRMKIHGVDPDYVRELKTLGYTRVADGQLIRLKVHGVSPEFIRKAQRRSDTRLDVDDLIRMKIHAGGYD
jgi:hypothetical protein